MAINITPSNGFVSVSGWSRMLYKSVDCHKCGFASGGFSEINATPDEGVRFACRREARGRGMCGETWTVHMSEQRHNEILAGLEALRKADLLMSEADVLLGKGRHDV